MKYLITAIMAITFAAPALAQGTYTMPFELGPEARQRCLERGITDEEQCKFATVDISYREMQTERDELRVENHELRLENEQLRGQVQSLADDQKFMREQLDQLMSERSAPAAAPAPAQQQLPAPAYAPLPVMTAPAAPPMADPMSVAWTSEPRNGEFLAMTGMSWDSCEEMELCTVIFNNTEWSVSIDIGGTRTIVSRAHGATTINPAPTSFGAETLLGPGQKVYVYIGEDEFDATYTAYLPISGTFVPSFIKTRADVPTKSAKWHPINKSHWSSL